MRRPKGLARRIQSAASCEPATALGLKVEKSGIGQVEKDKKRRKIVPKSYKNRTKIIEKTNQNRKKSVSGGFWGVLGVLDGLWMDVGPILDRKSRQHGPKLGPQMEPTWDKNRFKNQSKFWYVLGSILRRILVGFGRENGGKLATKSNEKWMWTARGEIFKKPCFSLRKNHDFEGSRG